MGETYFTEIVTGEKRMEVRDNKVKDCKNGIQIQKEKLTPEKLTEFLRKFEPVSIAWYLEITKKGIAPREDRRLIACYCCFDATGASSKSFGE